MVLKRLFDITASLAGLLLLWPVILLIAIVVRLTSNGPAFFIQKRVGKGGNLFDCIKFRTMVTDSEKEGTVTTAHDSRITPVGSFVRMCKLDELPQLWNVLIGKMSFVGPRPDVAGYADALQGDDRAMLALRPGITGPATLYFRSEEILLTKVGNPVEFNDTVIWPLKVKINVNYLNTWNFWKDIGYILITIIPYVNWVVRLTENPPEDPRECMKKLEAFSRDPSRSV